jgi:hypothetical protein
MSVKNRNIDNLLTMPKVQLGFAQARTILRDLGNHDADQLDAAFDVLIYSPHLADLELCEAYARSVWERSHTPKTNWPVVLVVMSALVVMTVSLAAILAEVLL